MLRSILRPTARPRLNPLEDRCVPAILTVTSVADRAPIPGLPAATGTLRDAVSRARDGDTVVFAPELSGRAIQLTFPPIVVAHDITIRGPGGDRLAIRGGVAESASRASSIFRIDAGAEVRLERLILERATGFGGGAIRNAGDLTLYDCLVRNCVALTRTPGEGGGAVNNSGTLTVDHSTLSGNSARTLAGANADPLTQYARGGAVFAAAGSDTRILDSTVSDNSALAYDRLGAVGGSPVLQSMVAEGGAVYSSGRVNISNSLFRGNLAESVAEALRPTRVVSARGGALSVRGVTDIWASSFIDNTAHARNADSGRELNPVRTTAAGGSIDQDLPDGAFDADGGPAEPFPEFPRLSLLNSTIARSRAVAENAVAVGSIGRGGAITIGSGTVRVGFSTVAESAALAGDALGGAIYTDYVADVAAYSSLFARNFNQTGSKEVGTPPGDNFGEPKPLQVGGPVGPLGITSLGRNLFETFGPVKTDPDNGDLYVRFAPIAPLASFDSIYSGSAPAFVYAVASNSPTIRRGTKPGENADLYVPETDQLHRRRDSSPDIGAYELPRALLPDITFPVEIGPIDIAPIPDFGSVR